VTPETLVAACDDRIRPLETAANAAWWNANVDACEAHERARAAADLALSDALGDADAFAEIRAAREAPGADPMVGRALTVLEHACTPHQVDAGLRREIIDLQSAIESRFARHRGVLDGEPVDDNTILEILRTSDDTEHRRAAWAASKTVGEEVASDLRRLVHLRNDAARRLGYRDHFAMALATTEFDERLLFATLDEVDALTREPFRQMKRALDARLASRFDLSAEDLRPWHYDDPFFQEVPAAAGVDLDPLLRDRDLETLTLQTFDSVGLDVRGVLDRSDLRPRDGKVQHAFCIDVDRAGDVRVLSNNVPGERWTDTMLHEFGHAVYFEGIGRDLPWLLRTMQLCLTEGAAMRCGRLVHEPRWLHEVARIPAETVVSLAPRLHAARRAALLVFARWVLVMTHFERGLYADPDGDHDRRWWDLVERFQLVARPDGRHAPDWAAKIHLVAAPVYYHNYLYGEMFASQLAESFGDLVDHPEAGTQLRTRLFAPGASSRWDRLVETATGAPLSAAAFARGLASEEPHHV
jgi:peptidyl-dipeptidase A